MAKIELDIIGDDSIDELNAKLSEVGKEYNINFKLLQEFGPAGGNPLYEVEGQKEDIIKYLLEKYYQVNPIVVVGMEMTKEEALEEIKELWPELF